MLMRPLHTFIDLIPIDNRHCPQQAFRVKQSETNNKYYNCHRSVENRYCRISATSLFTHIFERIVYNSR